MRRTLAALITAVALLVGQFAVTAAPAGAAELSTAEEQDFLSTINALRASRGVAPLQLYSGIVDSARSHTWSMQEAGSIFHTNNLADGAPSNWTKLGENVGKGPNIDILMDAFMGSSGHLRNLTDPGFTHIGIGVVRDGSTIYTTHRFMAVPSGSTTPTVLPFGTTPPTPAPGSSGDTVGVMRGRDLFLRNSNTSGPADYQFAYGKTGDTLIFGDWDGR